MENTAKNFALQLGSLVSLYVSIVALITLLFGVITRTYPDAAQGYWEIESAAGSIRFGIALLIVFFPTYIVLTRMVNTIRRNEQGTYLALTKWLIYLSLLIGGATMLGDLVALINSFLNGELTVRFVLKALVFLVVVGLSFVYYLFDARGYWHEHERRSIQYGIVVSLLVISGLTVGFLNTETPSEVRERTLDTRQINDLSLIQSQIGSYYEMNNVLPDDINAAYMGMEAPMAPEGRLTYEYHVTSSTTFELCATFFAESSKAEQMQYAEPFYMDETLIKNGMNWNHAKGEWCFSRSINNSPHTKL